VISNWLTNVVSAPSAWVSRRGWMAIVCLSAGIGFAVIAQPSWGAESASSTALQKSAEQQPAIVGEEAVPREGSIEEQRAAKEQQSAVAKRLIWQRAAKESAERKARLEQLRSRGISPGRPQAKPFQQRPIVFGGYGRIGV
jgi:hypothetical protein